MRVSNNLLGQLGQFGAETHSDIAVIFASSVIKRFASVFAGSEDPLC